MPLTALALRRTVALRAMFAWSAMFPRSAVARTPVAVRSALRRRLHDLEHRRRQGWNTAALNSLDVAQQAGFIGGDQGDGFARGAGTAGAADAMDVVFRHIGQFVVDHLR